VKLLPLALCIVATVLSPPCFAGKALDAIRTLGVLRVGTTGDYKPFTFRTLDGTYSGADIVMAQHLAQELQVKLEFVPTTWSTLLPDFMAHKYDIAMGGVSILPERAAEGDFSTPVNIDGKRPIVRCADKERFTTVAAIDKPGVRVVEPPGASNEAFARANLGHAAAPFSKVLKAYLLPKDDPDFLKLVNDWLAKEEATGDWLLFEVIDPFSKIEPDHGVNRAMSPRLRFIAKWVQWRSGRMGRAGRDDQRRQQAHHGRK
jgi:hypothetical protein